MEHFFQLQTRKLQDLDMRLVRSAIHQVSWHARLVGVRGPRGVGKTTLLLQYIKLNLMDQLDKTLYVSLDNWYFSETRLYHFAEEFYQRGGRFLFLDEVHKYDNWSQEIKNIYDDIPELKVVFTGSSLLEIINASADLSRRALVYDLWGLSFREFLVLKGVTKQEPIALEDIMENHQEIASSLLKDFQPFVHFDEFLAHGYYPYFLEGLEDFQHRLLESLRLMIEIELPLLRPFEIAFTNKMRLLLKVIANAEPFSPNVTKLSERLGINRNTLLSYLHFLDEMAATINLHKDAEGVSRLQKPQKVYIQNSNLLLALANEKPKIGTIRKTFFASQLSEHHRLLYTKTGDFLVDEKWHFEIGGSSKSFKQAKGQSNFYVAADGLEVGHGKKIPLWLFGFLY